MPRKNTRSGRTVRLAFLASAALAIVVAAVPLAAQSWRGTAGLDVEITERGKQPAAGAEVHLLYLEIDPKAGPAAAVTDSRGVATIDGLAEGKWRLEVRYQEKSPYSAVIQVAAGEKVAVVAGPVRDAAAPAVTVKFGKVRVAAAPPVPSSAPAPTPVTPTPATPARPPEPKKAPAPEPRPVPPAPAPEPRPPVKVEPPATPPAAEPKPAPPASPPPEPKPSPPVPVQPPPAQPAPVPPPSAPPVVAPPTPPPVQPAPPTISAGVRSNAAGNCPDCKAGEAAVSVQLTAGAHANPGACNAEADMKRAVDALVAAADAGFAGYSGPLIDPATGRLTAAAGAAAGEAVNPTLAPYLDPAGPCQVLAVVLAPGSRYTGYAYEANDAAGGGACVGGEECEVGAARWTGHPVLQTTPQGTVLFGAFVNRSAERARRAKLIVYFWP